MIDTDIADLFVDPETHERVVRADAADLVALRDAIRTGRARRRDAAPIGAFDGAFLSQGRRVAYLVEDGVPNFLLDERVEIDGGL